MTRFHHYLSLVLFLKFFFLALAIIIFPTFLYFRTFVFSFVGLLSSSHE